MKLKLTMASLASSTTALAIAHGLVTALHDLFDGAMSVGFPRKLSQLQPDEKARFDAVAQEQIYPYYTDEELTNATFVSSQFLESGEAVTTANRELILRIEKKDENGTPIVCYEFIGDDGAYLGFYWVYAADEAPLKILNRTVNGYRALVVLKPHLGVADMLVLDPALGQYAYVVTVPLPG